MNPNYCFDSLVEMMETGTPDFYLATDNDSPDDNLLYLRITTIWLPDNHGNRPDGWWVQGDYWESNKSIVAVESGDSQPQTFVESMRYGCPSTILESCILSLGNAKLCLLEFLLKSSPSAAVSWIPLSSAIKTLF